MAEYDGRIRILTEISTKAAGKSLGTLSYTITQTAKEISKLRSKMDALKREKIPTDDYKKLQTDLSIAEKKLVELVTKQEEWEKLGITSGNAWDALNEEIAKASDNVDMIKESMQALSDEGKDYILGSDTTEYATYERQLQYEQSALERMTRQYQELEKLKDPYARLSQSLEDLNKRLTSILHPIEAIKQSFLSMAQTIKGRMTGLAAGIINGIVHPFQTMKKISSSAISNATKLLSGMVSIAKKLGVAISSISSLLKKASSAMLGFGKSTKSSNNMLKAGFKNILKYVLGIRSMYVLINKLRTAIEEGFTNMVNEVEGFKSKVDSLKASSTTLKNAFAAAFRPLLEIAIPYIQKTIEYLTLLIDKCGQFIAAAMGQKTYTKAIKQTTAAIEGESKAQNKQLSGLDKLNNLSSRSGETSDSGSSTKMFEENVPITSRFQDMAQQLKNMWENADFTDLGKILGEKINSALERIPWNSIQSTVKNVGKSLATLLNGAVEVPDFAFNIAKTIGEAINTGIGGINSFLDNTRWEDIGAFIGETLNSLVSIINWQDIGHFFAAKLNATLI